MNHIKPRKGSVVVFETSLTKNAAAVLEIISKHPRKMREIGIEASEGHEGLSKASVSNALRELQRKFGKGSVEKVSGGFRFNGGSKEKES